MRKILLSYFQNSQGQSVIELLIAFSLAAIVITAFLNGFLTLKQSHIQEDRRTQAVLLKNETIEIIRNIRESGWEKIATLEGDYYPKLTLSRYELQRGEEPVNEYIRKVIFSKVYRDSSGNISDGGILDPSSIKVKVVVSWVKPISANVESTVILTRYLNNASINQPSDIGFLPASFSQNIEYLSNPQKIQLASDVGGWCATSEAKLATVLDLKMVGSYKTLFTIPGKTFLSFADSVSSDDVATVNFSESVNNNPPGITLGSAFRKNYQDNDVFAEPGYIYLATGSRNKQVVILSIDSTSGRIDETGAVNIGGTAVANLVYKLDDFGYVTSGNRLFAFDAINKSGNRNTLANITLAGNATSMTAIKLGTSTYVFVSLDTPTNHLQIIDATNLATSRPTLSSVSTFRIPAADTQGAVSLKVSSDGNRTYLLTSGSSFQGEFFILDTTNKSIPRVVGLFDFGLNQISPKAIAVAESEKMAVVVGTGGNTQLNILNLQYETSLNQCAGFKDISGSIYDASLVKESDGDSYINIITADSSNEFKIVEANQKGGFKNDGIYESPTFESTNSAAFNRFQVSINQPPGTSLKFKVSVAQANSNNNCDGVTFNYIGPSGNPSVDDYFLDGARTGTFTLNGTIPLVNINQYKNPGKCFRFKAFLNPDSTKTFSPSLESLLTNLSP